MQPMTVTEIASAVKGVWWNPSEQVPVVSAVSTDSRRIVPGSLFLPWVGEKFDGHLFIDAALDAGAAGCLCAKLPQNIREDKFYIKVADTRLALRDLASAYRDRFEIPFVQITGSVGKTTTKEMIAAVLGAKLNVLKTPENFNNDIGTPLTLLGLAPEHEAAVIETGMNHFGEIEYLGAMVRPDIAVISNIGDAHIERLGSRENIFKAKCELLRRYSIPIWVMEPVRGGRLASLTPEAESELHALRPEESTAAWAFRFLQGVEGVQMILSGMTTPAQMEDNVRTFEERRPLTDQEEKVLLDIAQGMYGAVPCTACRYCCDGCPMGLDIPMLLKLYNEAKFSPNFNIGMRVEALPEDKRPAACVGCGQCARVCPQNIDIPAALANLNEVLKKIPSWADICRQREEAARRAREAK
mgnify:CR=1 FL=1